MANANVVTITKGNFDEVVKKSDVPVLVDFWAAWCGPCRMVGPVIDELANEFAGKAKVGKVNVDEQNELAAMFRVMSIPTILLFKNGKVVEQVVGVRSKGDFTAMIQKHL